jgi:hypothetical protein
LLFTTLFFKRYAHLFFSLVIILSVHASAFAQEVEAPTFQRYDGQSDFDFEIGTWKTKLKRLIKPLSGSSNWTTYEGTTTVTKVLGGKANLVELVADGPAGHFEGLSLRLYNPMSHQWSLHFANAQSGTLTLPTIGEVKNGVGEFFSQDIYNERAILIKFVISNVTVKSCHFEQSFSTDGGKTWEVNWIVDDVSIK